MKTLLSSVAQKTATMSLSLVGNVLKINGASVMNPDQSNDAANEAFAQLCCDHCTWGAVLGGQLGMPNSAWMVERIY